MAIVRAAALLALAAGCGGDDDDAKPTADGGMDGGTDAGRDGSIDAAADAGGDACVPVPAGDGGSAPTTVFNPPGVSVTQARVLLLAPLYCDLWTRCTADAGTAEDCATTSISDFRDAVDEGTSSECLDAVLDFWACLALREPCATSQCTAAQTRCQASIDARDTLCAPDAGTPSNAN